MKPAHQTAEGERVSVWVLVSEGHYFGRFVSTRSRSAVVTATLTLWARDEGSPGRKQDFRSETAKGQYCPESDLLAEILRRWGHEEASREADSGQVERAFKLLGFECWGVL